MLEDTSASWTVLSLLNWAKGYFEKAGLPEPRLSGELLLAHALGCKRIDLYTRHDAQPSAEQLDAFRQLLRRAKAFEPVAYLLGYKEFYSLRLKVTPDVLIPRPESEALAGEAIARLGGLDRPVRLWDACTGCGCVAIAAAKHLPRATVLATDICPRAIAVAAENAEAHGLSDRVLCHEADLLSLPDDCAHLEPFDAITANPPYVAEGESVAETVKHEPALALYGGASGLDFLSRIVQDAPRHLRSGGVLIVEFGMGQADEVRDLISDNDAFEEPTILYDHQELERDAVAVRV